LTPLRLAVWGELGAAGGGWVQPTAIERRSAVAAGIAGRNFASDGYGATGLHRQPTHDSL